MSRKDNDMTIPQIIRERKLKAEIRDGYISLVFHILILTAAAYILFSQVFLITQAAGTGMFPAIKDGDLLIGFRLERDYSQNDVVVYTLEGKMRIGRIAARENDVVTLDESGTLYVNGTAQGGEILYPTYVKEGQEYPYRVPEAHVFVLGDYRTQTEDSRDLGAVPMDTVEGKVITILRRRGL